MPSTLLAQDNHDQLPQDNLAANDEADRKKIVDSPSNKLSSMKSLGSKIKEETKKLIRYPGKALKRQINDENDEELDELLHHDFSCFFKEHDILMEFKYVCKNPPSGVYVIPSIKSVQVWHGVIFLRAGPFNEGIFRFDILLPDNYPNTAPLVRFTSRIFHPQIHKNGVLNLEQAFLCWEKGESHISDVLKYVKSCFFNLNTWNALNEEAATCVNVDLDEFKVKARECVEESLKKFEEKSAVTSEDDGNLLKIQNFTEPLLNEWKQKLLCEDLSTSEEKEFSA